MDKEIQTRYALILAMRKMLGPIAIQMAEDVLEACRDADASSPWLCSHPFRKNDCRDTRHPLLLLEPTPVLRPGISLLPGSIQKNMGRLLNRFSGFAMLEVIGSGIVPS